MITEHLDQLRNLQIESISYFCFFLTILIYFGARGFYNYVKHMTLFQPILVALIIIIFILSHWHISYEQYAIGTYPLTFMIGVLTVALAVPLYRYLSEIRSLLLPIVLTLFTCGTVTVVVTLLIAYLLGSSEQVLITLSTKSVTTPIAMLVTEKIGGIPSLAAIIVTFTGIFGAMLAPPIFKLLKIKDDRVKGLTIGLSAHAIGTSSAFEQNQLRGAFAAIAMGLLGVSTAILLPLIFSLL